MHDLIRDISGFVFAEDTLTEADLIVAVGSTYPDIPMKAADLYHNDYAKQILVTGKYSYQCECFPGVSYDTDVYAGAYDTEARFYTAVLMKNGVPLDAVLREDEARCPKENALYTRLLLERMELEPQRMIVVCPAYQSRRFQMLFQAAFPDSEVLMRPSVLPGSQRYLSRDNWYTSRFGIRQVLDELVKCGQELSPAEIERICTDKEHLFDER
ncbi:MAG: YdcF family protein [Oscillospiraceae bacterium]|nr:YdcF family protein [Oscillospiraceae bacterium]